MNRLLIISCSATKADDQRAGACDLYTGPAHLQLAKIEREVGTLDCDVLVLSAKHGLIGWRARVDTYDDQMTPEAARAMADNNELILRNLSSENEYDEVFVMASAAYLPALGRVASWKGEAKVTLAGGRGIGEMRGQMAQWLREGRALAESQV